MIRYERARNISAFGNFFPTATKDKKPGAEACGGSCFGNPAILCDPTTCCVARRAAGSPREPIAFGDAPGGGTNSFGNPAIQQPHPSARLRHFLGLAASVAGPVAFRPRITPPLTCNVGTGLSRVSATVLCGEVWRYR